MTGPTTVLDNAVEGPLNAYVRDDVDQAAPLRPEQRTECGALIGPSTQRVCGVDTPALPHYDRDHRTRFDAEVTSSARDEIRRRRRQMDVCAGGFRRLREGMGAGKAVSRTAGRVWFAKERTWTLAY